LNSTHFVAATHPTRDTDQSQLIYEIPPSKNPCPVNGDFASEDSPCFGIANAQDASSTSDYIHELLQFQYAVHSNNLLEDMQISMQPQPSIPPYIDGHLECSLPQVSQFDNRTPIASLHHIAAEKFATVAGDPRMPVSYASIAFPGGEIPDTRPMLRVSALEASVGLA